MPVRVDRRITGAGLHFGGAASRAHGKTNPEIAAAMYMSPSTVKKRLEKINETLGVHSRMEAAFYAESLRHRRG